MREGSGMVVRDMSSAASGVRDGSCSGSAAGEPDTHPIYCNRVYTYLLLNWVVVASQLLFVLAH